MTDKLAADVLRSTRWRKTTTMLAHAVVAALQRDARFQKRRHQQRAGKFVRRLDHLRAVSSARFVTAGESVAALRPSMRGRRRQKPARPEGGELVPGRARALYAYLCAVHAADR